MKCVAGAYYHPFCYLNFDLQMKVLTSRCASPFQWPRPHAAHNPSSQEVQLVQHHVSPSYRRAGRYTSKPRSYSTPSTLSISPTLKKCFRSFAILEQNDVVKLGLCTSETCLRPRKVWITSALCPIIPHTISHASPPSVKIRHTQTPRWHCSYSTSAANSRNYIWICDLLRPWYTSIFVRKYPVSRIEKSCLRLQPVGQ